MKRTLKWIVAPLALVLLALVAAANLLAEPVSLRAEDFAAQPITLPDGERLPLAELLARMEERAPRPLEAAPEGEADTPVASPPAAAEERAADADEEAARVVRWPPPVDPDDPLSLAEWAYREERYEEALALFTAVPEDHPHYARAQRYLGWDLLTHVQDRPRAGLAHMNRALHADPLSGNVWQDTARVYLRAVGVRFDPVHGRWLDEPR